MNMANGTDLAIVAASVSPRFHQVSVEMSIRNPPIAEGRNNDVTSLWSVEVDDVNGNSIPGIAIASVAIGTTPTGTRTNEVVLDLSLTNPGSLIGWTAVIVTYHAGGSKTFRFLGRPKDKPKRIVGADSKNNADVYVSGTYSPSIDSPAQYSYDVAIGYGLPYFSAQRPQFGRLGFSVTGSTDQRPGLDPDSYYIGLFWQAYPVRAPHRGLQGVVFQMDTGGEFEHKNLGSSQTKTLNYLAPSPKFFFPARIYPFAGQFLKGVFDTAKPVVGFEYGHNLKNANQPNGSGAIARPMAGLDVDITYKPKRPFLYSLTVSSSWRGRYLLRSEIDTSSRFNSATQDFDFTFRSTTKPRNHITSKLEWKWTEFFGLTVSHELGASPPVFNDVDHSLSIGFTFSASFAQDAVQRRQ